MIRIWLVSRRILSQRLYPRLCLTWVCSMCFRGIIYKNDTLGYWGVSFPSDEPVVYRTQRYCHEVLGERPIQFQQFIRIPSMLHGAMLLLGMAYFALLSSFAWTRNLLFKVNNLNFDNVYIIWWGKCNYGSGNNNYCLPSLHSIQTFSRLVYSNGQEQSENNSKRWSSLLHKLAMAGLKN